MLSTSDLGVGYRDLRAGVLASRIWLTLGWLEIKQRYRRSTLGPLWLTLSTAILISAMGPLYAVLFGQDVKAYLPYLAVSTVLWYFISALITESCSAFIASEGYIKQAALPLSIYVLRVIWRNVIIMLHNAIVVVVALIVVKPAFSLGMLLVPVALLILVLNGLWLGLILGSVCARYRDIPQIVISLVQVAFFLTPVLWMPETLGARRWIAAINPLYHYLELPRALILDRPFPTESVLVVGVLTVLGFAIALPVFGRSQPRISYWV